MVARGVGWSPAGRPNDRIVADWAGSRLAWLEYSGDAQHTEPPELVVYDSRAGRRVARVSLPRSTRCPTCAHIVSVHGDQVVWADGPTKGLGTSTQRLSSARLHRYDIATGRKSHLSVAGPPGPVCASGPARWSIGESLEDGTVSDAIGQDFVVVGRTLVAGGRGAGKLAFDPRTGRRSCCAHPGPCGTGYGGERFYAFQWLDDDTLALLAGSGLEPLGPARRGHPAVRAVQRDLPLRPAAGRVRRVTDRARVRHPRRRPRPGARRAGAGGQR